MTTAQSVTNEELDQILQTIEMFEVILQSNPQDCQSMEILKEAYWKLNRQKEALGITRKLADTYYALGQFSSALLEYEGILQKDPNNPEVLAMLGEVEQKLHPSVNGKGDKPGNPDSPIAMDFGAIIADDPTLITTSATIKPDGAGVELKLDDDGNEALAKFLIQHRLASEETVQTSLDRIKKINKNAGPQTLAASLIDDVARAGITSMDSLLCGILDRSKFAYIPLDCYEVDRQVVKMLPETLTLGRLIVPFDLISRTIMIATANPFDAQGKEAVQQLLDYNIQWHVAAPGAISRVLRETYRLENRTAE
ncbi:MAG TPA: tetratricopeptide repeat protein [Chthoniobacteraceae bacterium]|jgi:tetratricopeptide (TPR) repeat protein|nr:tetratricopeptide repeat protein [Chthoniobacteraceae bacterium]